MYKHTHTHTYIYAWLAPSANLHALLLPELKPLLADYSACIIFTTPTAVWPFYTVVEDMLKQQ